MKFFSKIKSPEINIGSIIGITIGIFAILLVLLMGLFILFALIAMVSFTIGILEMLIFIRTKNLSFLVLTLFLFSCSSLSTTFVMFGYPFTNPVILLLFMVTIILLVWVLILAFTKRFRWRSREILELAALPVEEASAGYTPRPFPVGKVSSPQSKIVEFARFIHKNLIAIPYIQNGSIIMSINTNLERQIGLLTDFLDTTWVSFDKDGNVAVYISRADYSKYKDSFSFDQLCGSLGNLFIEFHDYFINGNESRIIEKLDSI